MTKNKEHTVVVLGASDKPERFSNKVVRLLKRYGYRVIPVHPKLKEIEKIRVANDLDDIEDDVDTLTIYVGPLRSSTLSESIMRLKPGRVIFNPGSESAALEKQLAESHIPFIKACTLVMLQSGRF